MPCSAARKGINLWASFRTPPPQRSTRLYQALVNTGLASAVNGGFIPTQHPFLYTLSLTATEGVGLKAVEDAALAELERVRHHGVTAAGSREGQAAVAGATGVRERQHHEHCAPARLLRDDRGLAFLPAIAERLEAVTVDQVSARCRGDADARQSDNRLVRSPRLRSGRALRLRSGRAALMTRRAGPDSVRRARRSRTASRSSRRRRASRRR